MSNHQPLFNVEIVINSLDSTFVKTIISKKDGTYTIDNLRKGAYKLTFIKLGYKKISYTSPILDAQHPSYQIPTINMELENNQLGEVVVKGNIPVIERRGGKTVINVENSVFASGGTSFEILQLAPGVNINSDGNISMKGKSGVNVYIDGKPSNLSGADLAEYLANLSTSNIEQIELLYTPSAKYDAEGNAGIINIKFKKGKNLGTNATYTLGGGIGRNYRYNNGLSINNRGKKTNFYGNLDFSKIKAIENNFLNRTITTDNIIFNVNNADLKTRNNYTVNLGFDYNITPSQTLGILFNGFINKMESDENNSTLIYHQTSLDSSVFSNSLENRAVNNGTVNLNYAGSIGKKEAKLSADLDYLNYHRTSNERFISNYYYRPARSAVTPLILNNSTPSDIYVYSFKVDFSQPLSKIWYLETGAKTSFANTQNNRDLNVLSGTNPFNQLTSKFHYKEAIQAAYFMVRKKKENSELQLQLRAEQTTTKGTSANGTQLINRNYLSLFPVLNYSKTVNKNDKLTLSYNRRLNRPDYPDLNPFFYFLDQYTYHQGNPNLKPSFANSYEVNYTINDSYSFSLQYNHIKDFTYTVYQQDDATGVAVTTVSNFDYRKTVGFEFDIPQDINKWLSLDLSLQNYYEFFKFNSSFSGGVKNSSFSGLYNLNASIKLGGGFMSQLNLHYETPTAYATYYFKSLYYANFGISKSIFNKKGSVRFVCTDPFDTNSARYSSNLYNLDLSAKGKVETRSFRLAFTYKIGKSTVKAARRRNTGVAEEKSRIKD
ncbi:MAG: TonB-dependent receptor [Sphingobacteriales bacterium]|nr:TonB-dependent receptor [Sphingobacteriales bacterium]